MAPQRLHCVHGALLCVTTWHMVRTQLICVLVHLPGLPCRCAGPGCLHLHKSKCLPQACERARDMWDAAPQV